MVIVNNSRFFTRLLRNSRFWILATGIVLSLCIAGIVLLLIPSGSLQIIRIEQVYGFIAVYLLIFALSISPITKLYPRMPLRDHLLHARRGIGVLTFYYAFLHGVLAFSKQLGGFNGIRYYNQEYGWSILLGSLALGILFVMAATSMDWVVRIMGFHRWKLLHRLVYFAGISILVHAVLIGSHFEEITFASFLTAVATIALVWIQSKRIRANKRAKTSSNGRS